MGMVYRLSQQATPIAASCDNHRQSLMQGKDRLRNDLLLVL
jgi:hypothetical protein